MKDVPLPLLLVLAIPCVDKMLIAMNYQSCGTGHDVSIHHCIAQGSKSLVALIFSYKCDSAKEATETVVNAAFNDDKLTNPRASVIEKELSHAKEVWLAHFGTKGE